MNILIYIPDLRQEWGGIKQYSLGLLSLVHQDKKNKYFVYHNNDDKDVLSVISNSTFTLVKDEMLIQKKYSNTFQRIIALKRNVLRKFGLQIIEKPHVSYIDRLCTQYKIDIIHCPYQFIPTTTRAKLITTLHDVQELHFPEYFTADERARRATDYLDYLRRSDRIVVSYDHVKRDLVKYFNIAPGNIDILLLKMDKLWFEKYTMDDIEDISTYNIDSPYLLYPANTWKHKNHLGLIESIAYIRDNHQVEIKLICTGHQTEHFKKIKEAVTKLNLGNQVVFLGVVPEKTLFSLYQQCKAVIIPTVYEAGSFPLYESILLNRPVICSNVTSLPETIGSNEFVFNPFNTSDIANKILQIWDNDSFRKENIEQITCAAKKLKENNPISKIAEIYSKLIA